MKRKQLRMFGLLLVCMMVVLSACGTDEKPSSSGSASQSGYTADEDGTVTDKKEPNDKNPIANASDDAEQALDDAMDKTKDWAEDAKDDMKSDHNKGGDAGKSTGRTIEPIR